MLLEFALIACVARAEPAQCAHVEGQRFATRAACEMAAADLRIWWQSEIHRDLPVPVHCQDESA